MPNLAAENSLVFWQNIMGVTAAQRHRHNLRVYEGYW